MHPKQVCILVLRIWRIPVKLWDGPIQPQVTLPPPLLLSDPLLLISSGELCGIWVVGSGHILSSARTSGFVYI